MEKNYRSKRAILFVLMAATMWGSLGITVKVLSQFGFNSLQMVVGRLTVSTILIGSYLLAKDRSQLKIRIRDIKWFIGTGIFAMLFFNSCYSQTVSMTSLSVAAILLYTSPIIVNLLSIPIFKERLTAKKTVAMILSVTGCALVSGITSSGGEHVPLLGIVFGIGAAFGYALYGILTRIVVQKYRPLTILFYTFLIASIGGTAIENRGEVFEIIRSHPQALLFLFLAAIICNVVPYILYTNALKEIEPSKASITASIEPVVATVFGVVLYQESISIVHIIGILLVLFAIVILNYRSE